MQCNNSVDLKQTRRIRLFSGSILYVNVIMVSPFPVLGIENQQNLFIISGVYGL
jgi:hypothetical protein